MKDVGDYLLAIYHHGTSVNSIRGHRTAVGSIHVGFKNKTTVSNNPVLNLLVRGMFNERPPERSLVPSWDLPRALRLLAKEPYEPMSGASLEDITTKTMFLVAAASGSRAGDIQGLSIKENHFDINNVRARLLPRSGYLAKNQRPDFTNCPSRPLGSGGLARRWPMVSSASP